MPDLPLNTSAYARNYGLPPARLVNMLWEKAPTTTTRTAAIPRAGLMADYSVGTGPIRGILLPSPAAFVGGAFTVSGEELYLGSTLIGAVPSPLFPTLGVRMACSDTQLVVVAEFIAYCDDAGVYGPLTDPDLVGEALTDVVILAGRFIYVTVGNKFWWSELGDATAIDSFAFASAESDPDALRGAIVVNDSVYFLGAKTIERWVATSDPDAPYQRVTGGGYARGCGGIQTAVAIDNSFIWMGENRVIYQAAGVPLRISETWIEERLRNCSDMAYTRAFRMFQDGHELYVLNIFGQGTVVYDLLSKEWSEWESYGRTTFRGCCADIYQGLFFGGLNGARFWIGDDETGQVWTMDPSLVSDDVTTPITRIVSAYLPVKAGVARVPNVMLQTVRGVGNLVDPGLGPVVEERHSDDGGRSWSEWDAVSLGQQGEYSRKAVWWGQGMVQSPGRHYEFRCTDPVNFAVSGAMHSEPRP